jgi:hypothetical protein
MTTNDRSACPDREPQLQAYLFGELSGELLSDLEDHLRQCRQCGKALEEAEHGLKALRVLDETPLPFNETVYHARENIDADRAWSVFLKEIQAGGRGIKRIDSRKLNAPALAAVAAAAILLIGVGVGRWSLQSEQVQIPPDTGELIAEEVIRRIDQRAVDALLRAELLADLAVPYVDNVLKLTSEILSIDTEQIAAGELAETGARARELVRDGWLLRRGLDPDRDSTFLSVIGKVELFLEEVAVLAPESESRSDLLDIQQNLRSSRLGDRLVALDVNDALVIALEASGWIGEDYISSSELRE